MIAETIPQLEDLSPSQKLLLASELWESALSSGVEISATDTLLAELDRRDAEFQRDPSLVTTWEEAEARIRASRP